jgi:protein-L-isoaspartate(D-aspartate) O-methyltransferase
MIDLNLRRRFFAEELEAVCKLRSPSLVDAFATVPREQFLRPGPWAVLADIDFMSGIRLQTRTTPDADPGRVYHNIGVAIDPSRQLFNGQPGTLAVWIDALDLSPGARVLHVGCGLGYYTAVMAQCVGPTGRVVAFEVDEILATEARQNLASMPWVVVRHDDASERFDDGAFDAILVNAGVTHPLDTWLDALATGGRMILPLTATMAAMGPIGKGFVLLLTKQDQTELSARALTLVAVYSAEALRDDAMNERLGKALMGGPMQWFAVKRLRRDAHEPSLSCKLHTDRFCLTSA